jgi:hypothetical protein
MDLVQVFQNLWTPSLFRELKSNQSISSKQSQACSHPAPLPAVWRVEWQCSPRMCTALPAGTCDYVIWQESLQTGLNLKTLSWGDDPGSLWELVRSKVLQGMREKVTTEAETAARKGPHAKEQGWPLDSGRGQEVDCSSSGHIIADTLMLVHWNVSEFWLPELR